MKTIKKNNGKTLPLIKEADEAFLRSEETIKTKN